MPLLRWLRRSPWLVLAGATMAAIWAVFLLAQWQGEQRWQDYCIAARLRGVKLTLPEFEQPAVDPEQNFAEIPLLRAAFAGPVGNSPLKLPPRPELKINPLNRLRGEPTDWAAWRKSFQSAGLLTELSEDPLRDVLRALEHYAPELKQWQEGSQRPFCRFPLDLKLGMEIPTPYRDIFTEVASLLNLRMKAQIAVGDSKATFEDLHDCLQCYRCLATEPTLIASLMRGLFTSIAIRNVNEGLAKGAWAEPELRKIQAELAALDFWQDYRLALSSERAAVNSTFNSIAATPPWKRGRMISPAVLHFNIPGIPYSTSMALAGSLVPRKQIRDNQLRLNRYLDAMLARIAADSSGINFAAPTPSGPETITAPLADYYFQLFSFIAGGIYDGLEDRYLRGSTACNEAIIACALERFKLARGTYPEMLAELAPDFCQKLPTDPYSGAALHYRRTPAGSFTLYSIGKNQVDDGGVPDDTRSENDQADAVWLYAPAQGKL